MGFVRVEQPCNPAVGGPAKSQLVHEVDALGGEIGRMADRFVAYLLILFHLVQRQRHRFYRLRNWHRWMSPAVMVTVS